MRIKRPEKGPMRSNLLFEAPYLLLGTYDERGSGEQFRRSSIEGSTRIHKRQRCSAAPRSNCDGTRYDP